MCCNWVIKVCPHCGTLFSLIVSKGRIRLVSLVCGLVLTSAYEGIGWKSISIVSGIILSAWSFLYKCIGKFLDSLSEVLSKMIV
jgi:hypothetical protein